MINLGNMYESGKGVEKVKAQLTGWPRSCLWLCPCLLTRTTRLLYDLVGSGTSLGVV